MTAPNASTLEVEVSAIVAQARDAIQQIRERPRLFSPTLASLSDTFKHTTLLLSPTLASLPDTHAPFTPLSLVAPTTAPAPAAENDPAALREKLLCLPPLPKLQVNHETSNCFFSVREFEQWSACVHAERLHGVLEAQKQQQQQQQNPVQGPSATASGGAVAGVKRRRRCRRVSTASADGGSTFALVQPSAAAFISPAGSISGAVAASASVGGASDANLALTLRDHVEYGRLCQQRRLGRRLGQADQKRYTELQSRFAREQKRFRAWQRNRVLGKVGALYVPKPGEMPTELLNAMENSSAHRRCHATAYRPLLVKIANGHATFVYLRTLLERGRVPLLSFQRAFELDVASLCRTKGGKRLKGVSDDDVCMRLCKEANVQVALSSAALHALFECDHTRPWRLPVHVQDGVVFVDKPFVDAAYETPRDAFARLYKHALRRNVGERATRAFDLDAKTIVPVGDGDDEFDNATYALFSLGGLELLVRSSLHAMEEAPGSDVFAKLDPGCVSLLGKPDYLLANGLDSEVYSDSERVHHYLHTELRPRRASNGPVVVVRVSAPDHRVLCLERLNGRAPVYIGARASVARTVLNALCNLADGSYVAVHSPGDAALLVYECPKEHEQDDNKNENELESDWQRRLMNGLSAFDRSYVKPLWRLDRSPGAALVADTFTPAPDTHRPCKPCRQFAEQGICTRPLCKNAHFMTNVLRDYCYSFAEHGRCHNIGVCSFRHLTAVEVQTEALQLHLRTKGTDVVSPARPKRPRRMRSKGASSNPESPPSYPVSPPGQNGSGSGSVSAGSFGSIELPPNSPVRRSLSTPAASAAAHYVAGA